MFDDIGGKLQVVAWVTTIGGILASILFGIYLCFSAGGIVGICVMVVGGLASWIGSWSIYALGQIAEEVHSIANTDWAAVTRRSQQSSSDGTWRNTETWKCSCGYTNPKSRISCKNCGSARP